MSDPLKTLIVDDNAVCREVMSSIIENIPDIIVVDTASDGKVALAKLRYFKFDLVIMDIDMPRMDGLEALRRIKSEHADIDVLMISSSHESSAEKVVQTLELGAIDFLPKLVVEDDSSVRNFRLNLLPILGLIRSRRQFKHRAPSPGRTPPPSPENRPVQPQNIPHQNKTGKSLMLLAKINVIAIASSTGGPKSLMSVIPRLPKNIGVPIFIVQHMPREMTRYMAISLNEKSELSVCEATHGEVVLPNVVYIAPGGRHMTVRVETENKQKIISLNDDPPENSVRPAADVLFRSIPSAYSGNVLAVIMTGMGNDGLKGVQALKQNMCYCLSQSADTCVVYGMPKAVDEAGISDEQIPLDQLAGRIEEITLKI